MPAIGDDTNVTADVDDADVKDDVTTESSPPAASPVEPDTVSPARTRSRPKSPLTRQHAEQAGRYAVAAATGVARAITGLARFGAHAVGQVGAVMREIPPTLRMLFVFGVLTLLAMAGSLTLAGTPGLVCAVVLVPICSITLGALGHRWFAGAGAEPESGSRVSRAETAELERSMVYADKKLSMALNSLGSDRHQHAVIALFQAKTAVELALGTENDDDRQAAPIPVDAYRVRPRIQAGSLTKADAPESDSLAAS